MVLHMGMLAKIWVLIKDIIYAIICHVKSSMWYLDKDYILIHQTYRIALIWHYYVELMKIHHVEFHSWCCAWLWKFTPTWCWPRVFTRLQRVLVKYCKISNIRHISVGYKIVHHSDVVGASPFCGAPTTSSFSTWYMASMDCTKTTARRDEVWVWIWDLVHLILDVLQ